MYDRGPYDGSPPAGPNPHHPLNQGAKGWWLVAPGYTGGGYWYEQFRQLAHNLDTFPSRAWLGSSRGWGCIAFDGVASLVGAHSPTYGVVSGRVWTYACWISTTSTVANSTIISEGNDTSNTPLFQLNMDQTVGNLAGLVWRDTAGNVVAQSGTVVVNDGAWHHLAGTSDGTTMSLYVDGRLDTQSNVSGVGATSLTRMAFGTLRRITNAAYWAGSLDDARNWARCLSAREVNALYLESLAGYPEALLYWRPMPAAFAPVGDPVFPWPMTMSVP